MLYTPFVHGKLECAQALELCAMPDRTALPGKAQHYNRELALYPEDLLGFVKDTQDAEGRKFYCCKAFPRHCPG